ncbi:hypothetical protein PanWU01x14_049130 [Parasponia andersonii]|uniref:Transmembrane protein n=1 Tax=Parasponia andersonii TaxID=3476 RepID=A0A2P5DMJ3_PARAD|nr:hypothetical protein PanWU01x14_049130 [Parasponia andersonii]
MENLATRNISSNSVCGGCGMEVYALLTCWNAKDCWKVTMFLHNAVFYYEVFGLIVIGSVIMEVENVMPRITAEILANFLEEI